VNCFNLEESLTNRLETREIFSGAMSFGRPTSGKLDESTYMRTINKDLLKSKVKLTTDLGNGGKLPMLTRSKIVDQRNNLFVKSFQSNQDLLASSQRLDRSIERAALRDSTVKLDQSNSNIVLEKKNRKSLNPEKSEMNPTSGKSRLDSLHGPKAEKPCRTFL
jgi:hypothetical protein